MVDAATRIEPMLPAAVIERALIAALAEWEGGSGPPRLAAAMRYAVFPGGARIRPRLCLAVACACGVDHPTAAAAAAASIELLHCASLVHDDLPCFDDAPHAPRQAVGASGVRRAAGGAGRRRADRAGVRDAGAATAWFRPSASRRCCSIISRGRRHADRASSPGRPGNASRTWCWRNTSGRRPARCSRPRRWPARLRRAPIRSRGACWASGSARPIRSPTTCATSRPAPRRLGKPTGRDVALGRPSAAGELGIAGALAPARDAGRRSHRRRSRAVRGAAELQDGDARSRPRGWCRRNWRAARRDADARADDARRAIVMTRERDAWL